MVTQTGKDKEGTTTGAGYVTDKLERPEAAGLWWKSITRQNSRNVK
jgi:hypothetical protein